MLESLLIGLLYILLYAVVASIIVYVIIYAAAAFGFPLPHPIPGRDPRSSHCRPTRLHRRQSAAGADHVTVTI